MELSRAWLGELVRLGWSERHRRRCARAAEEFVRFVEAAGPHFGPPCGQAFTAMHGLAWLEHGGWRGKTQRNRASVLRAFGDWLETSGRVSANPFRAIRLPRAASAPGAEPFTLEELRSLLRAVRALEETSDRRRGRHGPMRSTFYAFLALTGLRYSEAAGQAWADVDLAGAAIVVTCDKSRRRDVLPLCAECVGLLARWAWWSSAGGLVFPVVPCHKTLVADCARAGIARGRGAWHRFRKAAITERARRVATYRDVQGFARHTDPRITLGVYDRVRLDELRPVAEAMPALLWPPEGPSPAGGPSSSVHDLSTGDQPIGDKARERA